ncbi:hypothetical protein E4U41_005038 [Claviceps citrina]|nr:hypothetical protein E4U41_005038 [Claviceps citrina]
MTIKNPSDSDGVTTETMADRLRYVQTEKWRKMRYTDENDEAAWDVYNESLFLQPPSTEEDTTAAAAADKDTDADKGKGKGKDNPEDPDEDSKLALERDLEHLVPRFAARWNAGQMLEAVSGIVKPEPEPQPQPQPQLPIKREPKTEPAAIPDEAARSSARPRGGAAAAAAPSRRGARAKASSRTTTTINID